MIYGGANKTLNSVIMDTGTWSSGNGVLWSVVYVLTIIERERECVCVCACVHLSVRVCVCVCRQ